jgi:hypothetical protein
MFLTIPLPLQTIIVINKIKIKEKVEVREESRLKRI